MKSAQFVNNWRFKTLETLENNYWPEPEYDSYLVRTCHKLRKQPLNQFNAEDFRIMISQNIGLEYLIPLGLEALEENILDEGDFYEGDLLQSIIRSDINFWMTNPDQLEKLNVIIQKNESILQELEDKMFDPVENLKKLQKALNNSRQFEIMIKSWGLMANASEINLRHLSKHLLNEIRKSEDFQMTKRKLSRELVTRYEFEDLSDDEMISFVNEIKEWWCTRT